MSSRLIEVGKRSCRRFVKNIIQTDAKIKKDYICDYTKLQIVALIGVHLPKGWYQSWHQRGGWSVAKGNLPGIKTLPSTLPAEVSGTNGERKERGCVKKNTQEERDSES